MKKLNSFHLAIPVNNLKVCKDFYENVLECKPGRHSKSWADYNFFGHQLVIHFDPNKKNPHHNEVDGKSVPVPHFGIVLSWIELFKYILTLHLCRVCHPHVFECSGLQHP